VNAYFHGTPAHAGASPEQGHSALLAAAAAAVMMHSQCQDGRGTSRVNVGVLRAGSARNVVPAEAELLVETRGLTTEINQDMMARAEACIRGAAAAYGCMVTSADDGGSSGRLRKELGIIPPGDLRNCLTALADREPLMERLMQYRFKGDSPLAGHCFGNLFIAAMAEAEGGMEEGLNATSQILKVRGRVIPSTLENIQLQAEMSDGTIVSGESKIPEARKRIRKMLMKPADAPASKGAVEAILKSDVLIFGPGSLYTSVIPNLLVEEIREAILQSDAVKIYVCNVMTQPGETDGYGAFEHVRALVDHMGKQFLDYVIVNDQKITTEQLKQYYAEGSMPVTPDVEKIRKLGITVVPASLISKDDLVRHEPRKLARALIMLIYRLRLFGKGVQFFDYIFMRHGLNTMDKDVRGNFKK
ncbi:MAG: uridine diphosphate-N-acetylglucosamine-binding protein YvcK, partial [Phascolarctobacterium sp.]|nr:uridine diphosphate-N-acetylglucosamine-binding protein YvcK [Phascolarctobacterium sp.]